MRRTAFYISLVVIILIAASWLMPDNPLTGNTILKEDSCGALGCVQMCEKNEECGEGTACCQTSWETGVCDIPSNCPIIKEFSERGGSIEEYQTLRTDKPEYILDWKSFWLPLLLSVGAAFSVIFYYKKKIQ